MSVKEFYEQMYRDSPTIQKPWLHRKLGKYVLEEHDLVYKLTPPGKILLEIGCGDGELLQKLANKYQEVWGIDIASPRTNRVIEYLKHNQQSNVRVRIEDANQDLGFENNYFDTIIAVSVLEHLFDPYHFMKECHRILHSSGILILDVPNLAFIRNRYRLLFGKLPITSGEKMGWDGGHLHYFTRSSLKILFNEHGFRVQKITNCGIFAKQRGFWGSCLAPDIAIVGEKSEDNLGR